MELNWFSSLKPTVYAIESVLHYITRASDFSGFHEYELKKAYCVAAIKCVAL
jgi:hypothetical protein